MSFKTYLKRTNSFIRFLCVGVVNTIIGLSIMLLSIHFLHLPYWISTFIGNSIGACVSFLLNRSFTFESRVTYGKGSIKFIVVILLCYFCSYSLSDLFSHSLGKYFFLSNELQKDVAILLGTGIYTISNYFGQKYIVFKKKILQF
ncbi:GtrA family protein [Bacillus massilinigeriensis]|uniref:GtrA family protein n=1 Tax=Bacillus massilionigeriensis TaxID=1805475 RepID=UPI00096AF35C|nr:GtrA family protein [Bacillus massilionigeriensis]